MNIHQSKKGINLTDGFYLARNPRTQHINVISISKGTVYIHDVTRKMHLDELVNLDSIGYLEVFESLRTSKDIKPKNKTKE